jgi:hypothetical protein
MERLVCALTFLVLSATGSPSYAQVGDGQNGFALAQDNCSDCHAIRAGQLRSPNSRSPTFSELANTPGMTTVALINGRAHDAACRNADVHVNRRPKGRYHRLHPQSALERAPRTGSTDRKASQCETAPIEVIAPSADIR